MDGGKSSWAKSKKSVISTVNGAGKLVKSYDPDFVLIRGSGFKLDQKLSCK